MKAGLIFEAIIFDTASVVGILFHTAEMLSFQICPKAKIHNLFDDIYDFFFFYISKFTKVFISILGLTLIIVSLFSTFYEILNYI